MKIKIKSLLFILALLAPVTVFSSPNIPSFSSLIITHTANAQAQCDPTKNNVGCIDNPVKNVRNIPQLITRMLNYLLSTIAIASVLVVMIGGVQMILGSGSPDKRKQAKDRIIWAVVGLIVTLMSFSIVNIVQRLV